MAGPAFKCEVCVGHGDTKCKAVPTTDPAASLLKDPTILAVDPGPLAFPQRRCPLSFSELTDFQIICSDKVVVPVEKTMLARFSEQMNALLFSAKMKESRTGVATFEQIRSKGFLLLYRAGLGEFLRCEEPSRPFEKLDDSELVETIRFAHSFQFNYVLVFLLRDLLARTPRQYFFDLDSELELGVQSNLLDRLLICLQEGTDIPSFNDAGIYCSILPSVFGDKRAWRTTQGSMLQKNFISSLIESKLAPQVLFSEGLQLEFIPKRHLANLVEAMEPETAKKFILRVLRE